MSGAGNDFVVISKAKNKNISLTPVQISKLCSRRTGIGADGVIFISNSKDNDFTMEYFNADGSTGSLCGNGARCAIKFASDLNLLKNGKALFNSKSETYSGEVLNSGLVRFDLKPPSKVKVNFRIKASNQLIKSHFVNTGSPHVVIEIEDVLAHPKDINSRYRNIENFPVVPIGKEIRYHKDFTPEGTNVNFIQIKNGAVFVRTYERGVEDETLACGTGSVASAVIVNSIKGLESPIKIKTWGGDELIVTFQKIGSRYENISLTGPVKTIFTGEFDLNEIQ